MQGATQAYLEQEISLLHVLEKVGKEEVQGSGSAQACSQGMEEQAAVKQLFEQMSITMQCNADNQGTRLGHGSTNFRSIYS